MSPKAFYYSNIFLLGHSQLMSLFVYQLTLKPLCFVTSIYCIHVYIHTVYIRQKTLPFNETERNGTGRLMKRNGPFTIRSSSVRGPCVFAVRFESVLIKYYYIRTALSALGRGSL